MNLLQRLAHRWLGTDDLLASERKEAFEEAMLLAESIHPPVLPGFDNAEWVAGDSGHNKRAAFQRAHGLNDLVTASVETLAALTLGVGMTYGKFGNAVLDEALEEWWLLNSADDLAHDALIHGFLTGEMLGLIAQNGSRNAAAWVNLVDTVKTRLEVLTADGNPRNVTGLKIQLDNREVTKNPAEFQWFNTGAAFNKTRGVPPFYAALKPAESFAALGEYRLRLHAIRARLNFVLKIFAANRAEYRQKAAQLRKLPDSGHGVVLQKDPSTGQAEEFEMALTNTDARDAKADIDTFRQRVAMVFGIPEHFLAVGDTANRSTAESMEKPAQVKVEKWQNIIIRFMQDLFRKELIRRFGARSEFKIGDETVPVTRVFAPFALPPVLETATDLAALQFAWAEGLVSRETLQERLDLDTALEEERLNKERSGNEREEPTNTEQQDSPDSK